MACGTQVVPGYKEFNAKMEQHIGKDPALEMKLDQMMGEKIPLFELEICQLPMEIQLLQGKAMQ